MFSGREDRNAEKLLFWEERNDRWNERELFCGSLICRLRRLCGFCVQILSESDSSEVGVPHDDVCYEYSRCGADWDDCSGGVGVYLNAAEFFAFYEDWCLRRIYDIFYVFFGCLPDFVLAKSRKSHGNLRIAKLHFTFLFNFS